MLSIAGCAKDFFGEAPKTARGAPIRLRSGQAMRYPETLQSRVAREFRGAVAAGDLVTPNISGHELYRDRPLNKD